MNYSVTKNELNQAYELVTQDLFNRLIKAQDGVSIQIGKLGVLGSFKKSEHQMTSRLKGKSYGNTYAYYRLNFKMSSSLRSELGKSLERKYNRK